jgi:serine/threonine protein kinase
MLLFLVSLPGSSINFDAYWGYVFLLIIKLNVIFWYIIFSPDRNWWSNKIAADAGSSFIVIKQLGHGAFGSVDHVRSKLSLQEYAVSNIIIFCHYVNLKRFQRKRILRARTFAKDKAAVKAFENELGNLKRLRHSHLVQLLGFVHSVGVWFLC